MFEICTIQFFLFRIRFIKQKTSTERRLLKKSHSFYKRSDHPSTSHTHNLFYKYIFDVICSHSVGVNVKHRHQTDIQVQPF